MVKGYQKKSRKEIIFCNPKKRGVRTVQLVEYTPVNGRIADGILIL
jgi:hypothetical protein